MPKSSSALLLDWFDGAKRDLPWRHTKNPYHIWLSEIMLQQTRTETVKAYYARFLDWFPTVEALAAAPQEQVLKAWEGIGYYSRARNLQKAAQMICDRYGGVFPSAYEDILSLPGIGPYTAGAVGSIAFGLRVPAVDGNVYRVASRFFGVREDVGIPRVQKEIHALVRESIPAHRPGDYNQALMELGAMVCVPLSPRCEMCPWREHCDAFLEGDAPSLPIHEKKRPPKEIDVSVCLLTWRDTVLVMRRSERLLNGLTVFYLAEEESDPKRVQTLLQEEGLTVAAGQPLGTAKHVFTHRIWNMYIWRYPLLCPPNPCWLTEKQGQLANLQALSSLPFPSAMSVALAKAKEAMVQPPIRTT